MKTRRTLALVGIDERETNAVILTRCTDALIDGVLESSDRRRLEAIARGIVDLHRRGRRRIPDSIDT